MIVVAWLSVLFAFLPLMMTWSNLRTFTRPRPTPPAGTRVSLLIPARDEGAAIERAVRAALASTGVDVEVLVIDDDSTDDTAAIVERIARHDPRVTLLRASPLPTGWAGKQRACSLLAEAARFDVLMFVDVDVRLAPDAAAAAAARLLADPSFGLVSGFPRELAVGLGERLVIPWIHVLLLGYLPMTRMRASTAPAYGAACGQWIVARRDAYRQVGGHAATPRSRHDGTSLPRTFRIGGWKTDVFDGSELAECRMYDGFAAVWRGFSKTPGEGMATARALPVWTVVIGLGHVLPALLLVGGLVASQPTIAIAGAVGSAANLALRLMLCARLRQPLVGACLHPLGAALMLANQWASLLRDRLGRPSEWRSALRRAARDLMDRPSVDAVEGRGTTAEVVALRRAFDAQRHAFGEDPDPSLDVRLDCLARVRLMTDDIAGALADAISADFGHRSKHVTELADVMVVRHAIDHARRRLPRWIRSRRVATPMTLMPAKSLVRPQPLGVVGIVSPWNYPYQLSIAPAVSALAAGNRVMIKPSEATPRFSALLQHEVARRFTPDELLVVPGDADLARAFVSLPFDHLLFTGSTSVGREVALAAARNLTPVTLELGGKSPAILAEDCDLDEAVPRLMAGKLFNTGQTCIAPDYLLAHESLVGRLGDAMQRATRSMYPTIADNPDYCSIAGDRHLARLTHLLDDARTLGATVVPLHSERETRNGKLPPFALFDVDDRMKLMHEEIFGPLLPVVAYRDLDEAIAYVNARERTLALYWFGRDAAARDAVLARTVAGGVTVNDCLFHVAQEALPFGGVGASGHGRYHGEHGFRTFSHDKPVFVQSRWSGTGMMTPPYGKAFDRLAKWMRRLS